ncbi:MAG: hypothetical protein UT26_C0018G0007 [Microgenomates group bacterium GW2011_GWC1_39_12]|nr:MAG: hypothetical protein UT26_C0018G0007 [Microgenomates group bacterium GW2011_GWC1_39_12]
MMKIFAKEIDLGPIGGEGLGPFGNTTFTPTSAMDKLTGALSAVIGLMTIVAAFWFFITFITGGISWITAGGDKTKLTQARDKLTNAFVGLVIVVAGWAVLALAGQFFGWESILLPSSVIEKIRFGAN